MLFIKGRALDAESLLEIMMEGEEEVCEVDYVNTALHFIFNTEYASKLRDTLTFIENCLMYHNAKTNMPATMASFFD